VCIVSCAMRYRVCIRCVGIVCRGIPFLVWYPGIIR